MCVFLCVYIVCVYRHRITVGICVHIWVVFCVYITMGTTM